MVADINTINNELAIELLQLGYNHRSSIDDSDIFFEAFYSMMEEDDQFRTDFSLTILLMKYMSEDDREFFLSILVGSCSENFLVDLKTRLRSLEIILNKKINQEYDDVNGDADKFAQIIFDSYILLQ